MSAFFPHLMCGALFLLASLPVAAAPTVRFLGVEVEPVLPSSIKRAVFGGRDEKLAIQLDGTASQSATLTADLLQTTSALAMPLAKNVHLLDGITFPNGARQDLHVAIKFPEVKQRTQILVRFFLTPQGETPVQSDVTFEVFPASLTKELVELLQTKPDGASSPYVFGTGQKFRRFLADSHVLFEDGGESIPDRFDPKRLYFAELSDDNLSQQALDRSVGARLVLFHPDESLPLGIYPEPNSASVSVNLPLLDDLRDNPRSQMALIKVLHRLASSTITNTNL